MNLASMSLPDLIGALVGLVLTLLIFSSIFGDNALFRLAIHIFIGVAAGYAAVVAWYNVLWPQIFVPLIAGTQSDRLFVLFPLVLGVLLLFKMSPRLSRFGDPALAYLVGIGAATAIGGAVLGTIFPQSLATVNLFDPQAIQQSSDTLPVLLLKGSFIVLGTLATLVYFHFGTRQQPGQSPARPGWIEAIAGVGRVFIAITFGMLFAGVYTAALSALIERMHFIGDFLLPLVLTR